MFPIDVGSKYLCRALQVLLSGVLLIFCLESFGEEAIDLDAESSVPVTQTADSYDAMEGSRNYLSGKITNFASAIDRFFGGDRHYQESNPSVVQMDLSRAEGYGGDARFALAVNTNLKLPVTEGRLRFLVETDPERNVLAGQKPVQGNAALNNKVVTPKSVALALRLVTSEEGVWHFSTDGGLKFPIPAEPFVRTRGSYSVPIDEWRLKIAESVYWFNFQGVGAATQLDMERIINALFLFRASSNATWSKNNQNYDLRQELSLYHTLDDRTALLYQASVFASTNPVFQISDYVLLVDYRYRMHQKWLYFDVTPQLHFPSSIDYKPTYAISVRLELLFDDSR